MSKRLFKKGDIVVCIKLHPQGMYKNSGIDDLKLGAVYMIGSYKTENKSDYLYTNVYLEEWNGFSGNIKPTKNNCSFLQERFRLKLNLSDELKFKIIKFKFGIKGN